MNELIPDAPNKIDKFLSGVRLAHFEVFLHDGNINERG